MPAQHNVKHSVCPLDCPDTCSLAVTAENGRITRIRGSKTNPYTAGVICRKVVRSYPQFVHGDKRLRQPLRRSGPRGSGAYAVIGWSEALDRIHAGFTQAIAAHGPQSILPFNYAGPHGELAGGSMDRRFFNKLGASQLNRGPFCGLVRGTAYTSLFGQAPGMAPEQACHADAIIVWGNNVTVSNLHLARVIQKARKRGARLVVIDPKRTRIAEQADLYVQIRPGTDVVLAMALAAELERRGGFAPAFIARWVEGLEAYMREARRYGPQQVRQYCGLDPAILGQLADIYLHSKTVAVSIGNGIERGASGGSGLRAAMAVQALTGNFGRLGAGVIAKPGLAFAKTTERLQRPDLIPPGTRSVNIVDVANLLLDENLAPPISALFIYNHNPVCTHPDQNRLRRALSREDLFIAGADICMTDSMSYADVILPASSHFEYADIYGAYGHSYLQRAEAVIPPVGDSAPNTEIFRRLAARFGFDDALFRASDEELMDDAFAAEDPRLGGTRPSRIPVRQALAMDTAGGEPMIMCANVSPATGSGKIELFSQDLEDRFGCGLPRYWPAPNTGYPYCLISPSSAHRTNATFGGCDESAGPQWLEINPADAQARNILDGDTVRVWNDLGQVSLRVRLTTAVAPGVFYSDKGAWLDSSSTGQTVCALIPADVRTDIEEGACYNETFVEIEKQND